MRNRIGAGIVPRRRFCQTPSDESAWKDNGQDNQDPTGPSSSLRGRHPGYSFGQTLERVSSSTAAAVRLLKRGYSRVLERLPVEVRSCVAEIRLRPRRMIRE